MIETKTASPVEPKTPRCQKWYAVVEREGDESAEKLTIIEAPHKSALKKTMDADQAITKVVAVFRGKRMQPQTRRVVNFID